MTYLGNAFSLQMVDFPSTINVREVSPCDVPVDCVSCIGHADTAAVVSGILGREVPVNRASTDVGRTMRRSQFLHLIEACEDYKRNVRHPNAKDSIPYRDAVSLLCKQIFTAQELCGILTEDKQLIDEWNECCEFNVSGISWGRSAHIGIGKFEICWSRIDTQFHSGERPYGWPWETNKQES